MVKIMRMKHLPSAITLFAAVLATTMAGPGLAQLALPGVGAPVERGLGTIENAVDGVVGAAPSTISDVRTTARQLARERLRRIDTLLRRNAGAIERDRDGQLARKGELLVIDPAQGALALLAKGGFGSVSEEPLGELGIRVLRVTVPQGLSLATAQARLAAILRDATVTADTLHFQSGSAGGNGTAGVASGAPSPPIEAPVGMIDGAPSSALRVTAIRGFAQGAPVPSDHGTAVASLLNHVGVRRILAADVYGSDPAGGNALAISRALDWLLGQGARVVSISLVGPPNALLGKAVAAAQKRGVTLVAAVGNDGPAAPPAYPASYPGVLAVTGTDARNRPLIEAGKPLHLDYAAPGADMLALNAKGKAVKVRGTSFAAPLVAARAAAAGRNVQGALDAEALDLGAKGADAAFGRGLICGNCRRIH